MNDDFDRGGDTEQRRPNPGVIDAICKIIKDLAAVGIGKNRRSQQQGFAFRGIDDVYNAVAPLLAKHGLCVIPNVLSREVTERTTPKGTVLFYTCVRVEYTFYCADDGSSLKAVTYGEAMDSGDKSTNKAMSAAFKYALFQTFCIPTEAEDPDAHTHEVTAKLTEAEVSAWVDKINAADSKDAKAAAYKLAVAECQSRGDTDAYKQIKAMVTPAKEKE